MKRLRTAAKLIAINLGVLLVILWVVNLLAAVILDVDDAFVRLFLPPDSRAHLPNYTDKERAKALLGEFHKLNTRYEPFVAWSREEFRGTTTTVNGDGDRVHRETTSDPVGAVRFFGGSSMWGSGVEDEESIPALFNRLYPDYRVYNHGESGFTSRQSLARLVNLVNASEPMDLVVFYDGNNDVGSFCRHDVDINEHTRVRTIQRVVNPVSHVFSDLFGSIQEVLLSKFVSRHLYGTDSFRTRCHDDPAYARRVAESMVNNWKIARAVAKIGGAEFIAVLQPVASIGSPRTDHLSAAEYSSQKEQNIVYPMVRELMAEERADWMVDLTEIFDGDEYIYIDECHVTRNGTQMVAGRIAEIAKEILRDEPARTGSR